MKKFLYFFGSFLAVIGGISAIGMALAAKEFVIAGGAVVLAVAAFPTVKGGVKKLME